MALDASKVRVAVTGLVSVGLTTAAAPTLTSSALTGFADLGYIGEDGVTQSAAEAGDSNPLKAWQNGDIVRTLYATSEGRPSWTFTLLETKKDAIELYYGTTVTSAVAEGSFEIDTNDARLYKSFVLDVVDAAELIRIYVPRGFVASVGDIVYANQEPIGYEVTVEGERDSAKSYNAKQWATALKT